MGTFKFHTSPFPHQAEAFENTADLENFALFWEQGTGKSKITIDTAAHLYAAGEIDGVVVVAPGGVHTNWITDELPAHLSPDVPLRAFAYRSQSADTKWHQAELERLLSFRGLSFLAITYDAWVTARGKKAVWRFMKTRQTLIVLDESHRVKTPSAKRTRSILLGGRHAKYRRILSGTPVTNGPFDIYSQVRFLDPDFWKRELDIESFTAFKAFFGVWDRGYNAGQERFFDVLTGYQNIDTLSSAIRLISHRVRKEDVLDLPDKLYTKRYYEMTPAQQRVYDDLENDFATFLEDGGMVTANLAIVRMLRLQQVLCGYVPVDGDAEPTELIDRDTNPRMNLLKETMEDVPGKSIIWATWIRDIDMIMEELRRIGRNPVRYDGTVSAEDREAAKVAFREGDATDFVANSQMSEGLTLNVAKVVIYYNNSYRLLDRQQSEDRAHRIGQTENVTYIDLVCPGTRDEHAIQALIDKKSVAAEILGDEEVRV